MSGLGVLWITFHGSLWAKDLAFGHSDVGSHLIWAEVCHALTYNFLRIIFIGV